MKVVLVILLASGLSAGVPAEGVGLNARSLAEFERIALAMITLSGEPGSDMDPELSLNRGAAEQTSTLLDLLAALCNRERFPRGTGTDPDVPDCDPRCWEYLR